MKIFKLQLSTISIAIALSLGMTGNANATGSREAEALDKATVQLLQATQIAEKQESGKTIAAEFDIFVRAADKTEKVKIDASTGQPRS